MLRLLHPHFRKSKHSIKSLRKLIVRADDDLDFVGFVGTEFLLDVDPVLIGPETVNSKTDGNPCSGTDSYNLAVCEQIF